MNEQDDGSGLALDEVVRRFADSEQALSQARDKLEALAGAEETQAAAARGLAEASTATTELVKVAHALIGQAEETQRLAREVLQAGASLLDGTYLNEIQTDLYWTANAVKEGFERVEKLDGDIQERDQRVAELETELAGRTAKLSGRAKKQLGIE